MRFLPLTFSLTWLAATSAFATPTPEQLEFFEKQVRRSGGAVFQVSRA
jgi:hypothetical protein